VKRDDKSVAFGSNIFITFAACGDIRKQGKILLSNKPNIVRCLFVLLGKFSEIVVFGVCVKNQQSRGNYHANYGGFFSGADDRC